jgi:positive regulator of sigma E activity
MKDRAVVEKIAGSEVTLICGSVEMCRSCTANAFCSAKTREVSALNRRNLPLHKGDTVEFFLPPGRTILAGFVVLMLPLLTFILAFFAAGSLMPDSSEGTRALFGLLGLAGGFGFAFLYNAVGRQRNLPEILRRIDPEQSSASNPNEKNSTEER